MAGSPPPPPPPPSRLPPRLPTHLPNRPFGRAAGAGDARPAWLDPEDAQPARSMGRAWLAAAMGVILLALLAGAGWYATRGRRAPVLAADGAIVPAPAAPYKTRPANPGGSIADGTGDTSYAVAEGKPAPRVALAGGADALVEDAGPAAAATAVAATAAAAGVPVQVGAFPSAAQAEAQWPKLVARYPLLAPLHHRVVVSRADLGTVFGLQAMAGDGGAAVALCAALRGGGLACQVRG